MTTVRFRWLVPLLSTLGGTSFGSSKCRARRRPGLISARLFGRSSNLLLVNEIRVRGYHSGCGRGVNPQFGNLISQLYQLVGRVEYNLDYRSRLPMVLPLTRINNLVHIGFAVEEYCARTIELARQNAMTLQSLDLTYYHRLTDISRIIRDDRGSYVTYPCLCILILRGSRGYNEPGLIFDDVVPFPSLRCLHLSGRHPFDDDTLLRGNAATLETLFMDLDYETIAMLRRHNVFTPDSHPRLQCVRTLPTLDIQPRASMSFAEFMLFALSIGWSAAGRVISDIRSDEEIRTSLSLISSHSRIQYLSLPHTVLSLWDVLSLVKSLPLLSDLHTRLPRLGPVRTDITWDELLAYVISNYYLLSERFRRWYFEDTTSENVVETAECILLLALVCPSFRHAISHFGGDEQLEGCVNKTIAEDRFKACSTRLRNLDFA
ncbi:hypothetical protein GGH93_000273 [Coemansia aciculifera]|nr:hypothetical protein GGH93_000273 [Coemansia aciculifera]